MTIQEAKLQFTFTLEKLIGQALKDPSKSTLDEQNTLLQLSIPGYDYKMYGADDDAENLNYFLNLFCDYANGKTNINTNNMIWFESYNYIILLWKIKED